VETQRTVTLWSANGLTVTARRGIDDNLLINGQDLRSGRAFGTEVGEYEYGFTVPKGEVSKLLDALDATGPEVDVLDLLEQAGPEIVRTGESKWLAALGVEAEFWSRSE
jgi:hypothetical protein